MIHNPPETPALVPGLIPALIHDEGSATAAALRKVFDTAGKAAPLQLVWKRSWSKNIPSRKKKGWSSPRPVLVWTRPVADK